MRTETWNGHDIRFVEIDGEWWAVLDDVVNAVKTYNGLGYEVSPDDIDTIVIDGEAVDIVDEIAIYEYISKGNSTKAIKFKRWSANVMKKLRRTAGLESYEVFRMMDDDVQKDIDHILDTLYYDEEKGMLMRSITVAGGAVEQVEFK